MWFLTFSRNKHSREWITLITDRFFEKNKKKKHWKVNASHEFFHWIHYNIRVNERRWTNKPPLLCRHFFARGQWTIDPERNRWIRRKFVSPQIMEIEIDSSSTVRYVFVSSRDVAYVTREENGAILVTRNTCF